MGTEINDIAGLICLESGTLPVHGGSFSLVLLEPRHAPAVRALHETVIERLPEDQKSFVLPRPEGYFRNNFQRGHGSTIMGVVCGGKLIAKCLIVHPSTGETSATLGGAILHCAPEHVSIFQSSTVHPDFRGNGIMNMMIRHWLSHATRHGRIHVQAEIETRNKQSWSQFLKAGLHIVSAHKSPVDGAQVFNAGERIKYTLMKDFSDAASSAGGGGKIECPSQDMQWQMERFSEGFIATALSPSGNELIMEQR